MSDAETDGLALRWGDAQAMLAALEAMAFRRGRLGNLLAEGSAGHRTARMGRTRRHG